MAAKKTRATKTAKKAPAKPAHRKRRNSTLLQGDVGEKIVADAMPEQWLVRKVDRDFGIDLHVEVFDWVPDDPTAADTLGEHFFVQVKSQATLKTVKHVARSRGNVAKYVPDPGEGDAVEFRVVACSLEVGELMTIEAMGNAVPVLLCVAAVDTGDVYYLCLNDYISKVLLPNNPNYAAENHTSPFTCRRGTFSTETMTALGISGCSLDDRSSTRRSTRSATRATRWTTSMISCCT